MSWLIHGDDKAKMAGATEGDEVLYVICVEDLVSAYEELYGGDAWTRLSEDEKGSLIYRARKYMESFCGDGAYTFVNALEDAIAEFDSNEAQGE